MEAKKTVFPSRTHTHHSGWWNPVLTLCNIPAELSRRHSYIITSQAFNPDDEEAFVGLSNSCSECPEVYYRVAKASFRFQGPLEGTSKAFERLPKKFSRAGLCSGFSALLRSFLQVFMMGFMNANNVASH